MERLRLVAVVGAICFFFLAHLSHAVTPPPSTNLPLDPGVAGEVTIEGIDANGNGVRDDLELAIFAAYPDNGTASNAAAREILYNSAIAYQSILTHPSPLRTLSARTYYYRVQACNESGCGPYTTSQGVVVK
jgi:hypothetical protein